jgi:hypothetical protein
MIGPAQCVVILTGLRELSAMSATLINLAIMKVELEEGGLVVTKNWMKQRLRRLGEGGEKLKMMMGRCMMNLGI